MRNLRHSGVDPFGPSCAAPCHTSFRSNHVAAFNRNLLHAPLLAPVAGDIREKYQKAKSTAGEEPRKAALVEFWASSLPELFKLLERVCDGSSSGAVIGNALSYADVCMYVLANEYFDNRQGVQEALKGCPKLMASAKAVESHPNIVKYLAARPATRV